MCPHVRTGVSTTALDDSTGASDGPTHEHTACTGLGPRVVRVAVRGHRLHGGGQRLAEDLATEDGAPAEVLTLTTEEVLFDLLEGEELDELGENLTQWEINFVESLRTQMLHGHDLSKAQLRRLEEIREARL